MRRGRRISRWLAVAALAVGMTGYGGDLAEGADPKPGVWIWGAGLGFLKDAPDGTAVALNANVEPFVLPNLSVRCCSSASLGIPRGD
jgi:hypothetical protein